MKNIHPVIKLFIAIILLYVGWQVLYQFVLTPGGPFDFWLTKLVTKHSVWILNLTDHDYTLYVNPYGKCSILRDHVRIISVNHACNGQVLYPVFMSFVIVTRGPWLNKVAMILLGSIIIYLTNLLRVISLVFVRLHYPKYLDFNHKYTFVLVVYVVIFTLWVYWINKFSKYQFYRNANTQ